MVEEGQIAVRVYREAGDVVLSVTDNGAGMSPEQVGQMMARASGDRTGIGIRNVSDRLRIYFGEPYGLRVSSEPDVGTRVEIRMPAVEEGSYEGK